MLLILASMLLLVSTNNIRVGVDVGVDDVGLLGYARAPTRNRC